MPLSQRKLSRPTVAAAVLVLLVAQCVPTDAVVRCRCVEQLRCGSPATESTMAEKDGTCSEVSEEPFLAVKSFDFDCPSFFDSCSSCRAPNKAQLKRIEETRSPLAETSGECGVSAWRVGVFVLLLAGAIGSTVVLAIFLWHEFRRVSARWGQRRQAVERERESVSAAMVPTAFVSASNADTPGSLLLFEPRQSSVHSVSKGGLAALPHGIADLKFFKWLLRSTRRRQDDDADHSTRRHQSDDVTRRTSQPGDTPSAPPTQTTAEAPQPPEPVANVEHPRRVNRGSAHPPASDQLSRSVEPEQVAAPKRNIASWFLHWVLPERSAQEPQSTKREWTSRLLRRRGGERSEFAAASNRRMSRSSRRSGAHDDDASTVISVDPSVFRVYAAPVSGEDAVSGDTNAPDVQADVEVDIEAQPQAADLKPDATDVPSPDVAMSSAQHVCVSARHAIGDLSPSVSQEHTRPSR